MSIAKEPKKIYLIIPRADGHDVMILPDTAWGNEALDAICKELMEDNRAFSIPTRVAEIVGPQAKKTIRTKK